MNAREIKNGEVVNGMEVIHAIGDPWEITKRGKTYTCTGSGSRYYKHYHLKCQKCGFETQASYKRIVDGLVGCKRGPCNCRFVDLTGRRFGRIVVLNWVPKTKGKGKQGPYTQWRCKCDCGEVFVTYATSLTLHNKIQCTPCARKAKAANSVKPNQESAWNRTIRVTRRNAEKAGREYSLTAAEFKQISSEPCFYCGAVPNLPDSTGLIRNGIDRYDNNRGYVLDNCKPCCLTCNVMKGRRSHADFLNHILRIIAQESKRQTTIPQGSTPKQVETERALPQGLDIV